MADAGIDTGPAIAQPVQVAAPAPARTVETAREPQAAESESTRAAAQQPVLGGPPQDGRAAMTPVMGRDNAQAEFRPTCTVAQLRRFIKSRPWIPMHELRRRFGIYGADDDVSPMHVGGHVLFVGLPPAEGRLMEELLDGGDVGYELSLDPITPIVVGVYPMRPVPRG